MPKTIYFTVTNDLSTDQRMQRITTALASVGYEVHLVGRTLRNSKAIEIENIHCHRFNLFFQKGKLFYLEYNIRLFWFLLFRRWDAVCAIDLDTIAAAFSCAIIKRKIRVYDAHEYFTEVPELKGRPATKNIWEWVGNTFVPKSHLAYSVGPKLAGIFTKKYKIPFQVIRNVNFRQKTSEYKSPKSQPYILIYQGVLNEGRGLEAMIESLTMLPDCVAWILGDGVLLEDLKSLARQSGVEQRVKFWGKILPKDLPQYTSQAYLGFNLLRADSLNYYYSLANKFYDYLEAGIPVINMNFPEYQDANSQFETSILIDQLNAEPIANAVQSLISNPVKYHQLQLNCLKASEIWNWDNESKHLIEIYSGIQAKNNLLNPVRSNNSSQFP